MDNEHNDNLNTERKRKSNILTWTSSKDDKEAGEIWDDFNINEQLCHFAALLDLLKHKTNLNEVSFAPNFMQATDDDHHHMDAHQSLAR